MKIRITQSGIQEFRDVYEFTLTKEQVSELRQNLKLDGRTLKDLNEQDIYDLGFELVDPVETLNGSGEIIEDQVDVSVVKTTKKEVSL
jgi:hypothetical protein